MRDYEGRVGAIQVDPGPDLVEHLDTTPAQAPARQEEDAKLVELA
jgi:hypothetical protein